MPGKHRLPRFHPDEKQGQPRASRQQTLFGESTVRHVRPEKEQPKNEWQTTQVIAHQRHPRRPTQEMKRLFGKFERTFFLEGVASHLRDSATSDLSRQCRREMSLAAAASFDQTSKKSILSPPLPRGTAGREP